LADGREVPFDEGAPVPPPGAVRGIRGAAGNRDGLLDVSWCRLPVSREDPGFSRRLAQRRAVALALLFSKKKAQGGKT